MKIPVFGLVMIFVIWLSYELKKHTKEEAKTHKDFWERERKSGFIPRKSTSDIHYITITESFLPVDRGDDTSELNVLCKRILNFSDKKIADLSSMTNTELKEKYGTANFTSLSEADTNFTNLVPLLGRLCELLYEEGRLAEAETAALFCVDSGIMTYPVLYTLGNIYSVIDDKERLDQLISKAETQPSCQERTLNMLKALSSSSSSD
ncbi:MAG: hypothetical protein IKP88_20505 [Lachnospiraceae bacterium]|nr:hypothetical protein [Lachnospiraceae bacterium]